MKHFRLMLANLGRRSISIPNCTPPLGLLSLAAYVRDRFPGAEIRVVDQRINDYSVDQVLHHVREFSPDIVGVSSLTTFAHMMKPLASGVREMLPNTLIVAGGPHASAFGRATLEQFGVDAAVVGEGELALEAIINARLDGDGLGGIPGLIWRDTSGEIVENPGQMPYIEDLDALPFLAYDLVDVKAYWRVPPAAIIPPRKYVSFFSSRGCPNRCMYCHNLFGKRFRSQSAERLAAEVGHFTKKYGVREIELLDDMFNKDPQRVIDFCDLAVKRNMNLRISFPNSFRTDILTEDVMDAMVGAGLFHAAVSLESGSPRIQKVIRKHLNIPRFLDNVGYLVKKGVYTHGYTMLGFPTETEEEMEMTVDTACASPFHAASFFTVLPFPGSEIHALAMQTHPERMAAIRYTDVDFHHNTANLSEVPDEVFYARVRQAWRRFYLRPRRIYRLLRDFPERRYLPLYLPTFVIRQFRGLFSA